MNRPSRSRVSSQPDPARRRTIRSGGAPAPRRALRGWILLLGLALLGPQPAFSAQGNRRVHGGPRGREEAAPGHPLLNRLYKDREALLAHLDAPTTLTPTLAQALAPGDVFRPNPAVGEPRPMRPTDPDAEPRTPDSRGASGSLTVRRPDSMRRPDRSETAPEPDAWPEPQSASP